MIDNGESVHHDPRAMLETTGGSAPSVRTLPPMLELVHNDIAYHADCVKRMFKPPVKVTIIARNTEHPDGSRDVLVTADDIDAVISALTALKNPAFEVSPP